MSAFLEVLEAQRHCAF